MAEEDVSETPPGDAGEPVPPPAPKEPHMEIHKPKPVHSWREFLKEYAIIVLGVLTALGLEQSVEAFHERQLAREAEAAIRAEMTDNVNRIQYRLSYQSCIEKRLDDISALLEGWPNGKEIPAGIHIGAPGDIIMNDQRWQANLDSGRFSRQVDATQESQAFFYTILRVVGGFETEELAAWDQLRALERGSKFLTLASRPKLIEMLVTARARASDIALLGEAALRQAKAQNILPDKPFPAVRRDTTCQPLMSGSK
jgi:hypothetical protein